MVRRKLVPWCVALLALSPVLAAPVAAAEKSASTAIAQDVHLGVASCASSVCHGRAAVSATNRVWMTEYRVWQRQDPHATAFETLLNEQSRRIASRLGIGDPSQAAVCLDCHADNVPVERRGERFRLSDGVGCEACHGGGEHWLAAHADRDASHADNLRAGMYPTADPGARAALCLSCHQGTPEKFASHDIMAAGHPQLLFELATYSVLQPMHYSIDADYQERKGPQDPVDLWLHGLTGAADAGLELVRSRWGERDAAFPEVALYQCDSCHRELDSLSAMPAAARHGLPSGAIPLNDSAVRLLGAVAQALRVEGAEQVGQRSRALTRAASLQRSMIEPAIAQLQPALQSMSLAVVSGDRSAADLRAVRSGLLGLAAKGEAAYFPLAFHVYLGISQLNGALGDGSISDAQMARWFDTVATETTFEPEAFARHAARLLEQAAR